MKEHSSKSPQEINDELNRKYNAFRATETQGAAQWNQALTHYHSTAPSEETTKAVNKIIKVTKQEYAKATDDDWITAMNTLHGHGITDKLMLDIWNAKEEEAKNLEKIADEPNTTPESADPLEQLLTESTPWSELNAQYEESTRRTAAVWHEARTAWDKIKDTSPTEESLEAVTKYVNSAQKFTELDTDDDWVKTLYEHPYIAPETVREVWGALQEKRTNRDNEGRQPHNQ